MGGASAQLAVREIVKLLQEMFAIEVGGYIMKLILKSLPILYMAFIWYLSSYPSDAVIHLGLPFEAMLKESLHLVEFAGVYILWVLFFLVSGKFDRKRNILAVVIAIAYGFIDETHQYFVPSRSAAVIDLVKDTVGVMAAWYVVNGAYFNGRFPIIGEGIKWVEERCADRENGVD
ncbi:VanZ family protein [Metallumcola ferriviriculae]|uniref:VanZ family protein n=1 Tax=Metallumcola ferriviriculae TaxID=3039180 RepID=A0AAU0UQ22_9FIRM|nr:VanZ family protein [Desulfitibacteraceae bacterium MK1]